MKINHVQAYKFDVHFKHEHGEARGSSLTGTDEVMHIHSAFVSFDARGQGLGDKYHKERINLLTEEACIKYLTCIVNSDNQAQIKIVEKNGWELLKEFDGFVNKLRLYGKQL